MNEQNGHQPSGGVLMDVVPPQSEAEAGIANMSAMLQGALTVDPAQLLGRKEVRIATLEGALSAAIEALKPWASLNMDFMAVKALVDAERQHVLDAAAQAAVTEIHAAPDLETARGDSAQP